MKLDSKIKSLSSILTCFDNETAKSFIGQKGYFTNDLYRFSDVLSCYHDTLTNVKDNDDDNYIFNDDDNHYWDLFIPESRLLIEKKKYRPFDPATFEQHYDIGSVIEYDGIWYREPSCFPERAVVAALLEIFDTPTK